MLFEEETSSQHPLVYSIPWGGDFLPNAFQYLHAPPRPVSLEVWAELLYLLMDDWLRSFPDILARGLGAEASLKLNPFKIEVLCLGHDELGAGFASRSWKG